MNDDDTRGTRRVQPLHQALLGAVFPLSAEQLVRLARENEAPVLVLSLLSNLQGRRFESLDAVQQALESRAEAGQEAPEASSSPMSGR